MCFSGTASFVAGTALSVIGVATIRRVERRTELPLALIPLFFGVQQLVEGVLWLALARDAPGLQQTMTYIYSVFSHVFWPIYVPFAVGLLESTQWRKRALRGFQAAGLIVGLYLLFIIITQPVAAEIDGHHIVRHIVYLSPHFYLVPVMVLYLAATCVSFFISRHPFLRLFGVLALVSFIAAYLFYSRALVSVWCFFAAVLSVVIYVHLRYRNLGGFGKPEAHGAAAGVAG
jgi:hypothetical protein